MISLANMATPIITINCGYYLCLWVFQLKCEVYCVWVLKKNRGDGKITEMGGDLLCIELTMIEENVRKPLVWYLLKKGGFVSFMEVLNGHDKNCSMQFVKS